MEVFTPLADMMVYFNHHPAMGCYAFFRDLLGLSSREVAIQRQHHSLGAQLLYDPREFVAVPYAVE